ncbi:MAG: molybdate ABC transporter substrate-binding protein [Shimia sp.]|uniref:molybdate ABC transporter substrate-binding protein n=1 Tax=Shimia sp. TaxID=1954381 RepID=UPI004058309D
MSQALKVTLIASVIFLSCGRIANADINIFAAASLRTVLEEVAIHFEAERDLDVEITVAGSSILARQIEFGAPADVFISANTDWVDHLEAKSLLVSDTRRDVIGNRLVLVQPLDGPDIGEDVEIEEIFREQSRGRLAMALVDAVPAGIYGKEALQNLGQWQSLQNSVVQTDNVRAALALVALGAAQWGIVYASDVLVENRTKVAFEFPALSHAEIVYPAAVVKNGNEAQAADFIEFLSGPVGQQLFVSHGFSPLEKSRE